MEQEAIALIFWFSSGLIIGLIFGYIFGQSSKGNWYYKLCKKHDLVK